MKFTKIQWGGVILFSVLAVGEIALRCYGFAKAPLYFGSNRYEYMACPNQEGMRFGNRYHYNAYSQRSEEPDSSKVIVLGLGDSVLFGGVQTDQADLATSLFSEETGMQMLNISAGSWGPDNCAAYLREKGLFTARSMFLVVSSHDAYDNMDFLPVVGVHPSYPDRQYSLAWGELIERYLLPRLFPARKEGMDPDRQVLAGIRKNGKTFNSGFGELKSMADSVGIPLIVYLHAERSEMQEKAYNDQGNLIIAWAKENGVRLVKELDYPFTVDDYRDGIHLNKNGQRKLATIMESIYE